MIHDCIVLTGAAGRLGSALRPALAPLCKELRLVDKSPAEVVHANESAFALDLNDEAGLKTALAGCSAVVHFAGYPREAEWNVLLAANIQGVINLWDAAHAAGVGRIIYASSNHAVSTSSTRQQTFIAVVLGRKRTSLEILFHRICAGF